jgi:hypothetical protein
MMDSTPKSTASMCAEAGLPVFPLHGLKNGSCTCGDEDCELPGEHPRTANGLDDATTDPEKIREFWTKWPKAKIGIVLGAPDIIAAVVPEESEAKWQELVARTGDKFKTVEFYSQGSHFFLLRAPPNDIPDGEITLIEGRVVGRGGYVVMPGSLDTSGEKDRFVAGHVIGDIDIESAPDQLLKWLRPTETGIELPVTHSTGSDFNIQRLDVNWIEVPDDPCNPDQVKLFAEGMRVTGVRNPLTVRPIKLYQARRGPRMHRFALLSDPHQLAARKSLGFISVDCIVMDINERDARLWQIADIIHRPDLSVIDWAELVMEWVRLVREKGGHDAHPQGGKQPHDKGLSEAERVLGVSRRDLRRAEQICSICDQAKQEIRKINLNVRKAVLKVASEPVENQVAKVHELADAPKRVPAADPSAEAGAAAPAPEKTPAPPPTRPEADPARQVQQDSGQVAEHHAGRVPESPPTVPDQARDDLAIPPILDRTHGEQKLAAFKARWSEFCEPAWRELPPVMQTRFVEEHLGYRGVGKVGKNSG